MSRPDVDPAVLIPDDEIFVRMSRAERWQHGLLVVSFCVLALTGLPLLFGWGGASPLRGILHRAAALAFIGSFGWHLLYTLMTGTGRRNIRDKAPRGEDVKDAVALFGFNLGLASFLGRRGLFRRFYERRPFWRFDKRPDFGRYSFVEKFDYWAMLLGSAIMILTGLFMGAPGLSLRLFPLWLHQVFVVIHGCEAVLAVLAVLIWHLYAVHLNPEVFPMSRVWLDGKMTGAEMRRSHPLEYRRILEERKAALPATGVPEKSIIERE